MKARFYDPDTGRFLNQDAYLGENGTPPSLHRYLYAYSNPAYYIDPDGHFNVGGDPLTNEAEKKSTEQIIVRTSGQAAATSFAAGASKFVPGVGILITVGTVGYQAHQLDQRLEAQAEANIRGTEAASEFQLPHERELLDKLRQREIFKRNNPNVLDATSGSGAHSDSVNYGGESPSLTAEADSGSISGGNRVNDGVVQKGGQSVAGAESTIKEKKELTPTQSLRRDQQKEFNKNSKEILNKNEVCTYCQNEQQQASDHIVSVQRTQKAVENQQITRDQALELLPSPDNLTGSCTSCNSSKGGKPLALDPNNVNPGEWPAPNPMKNALDKAAKAEEKLKGL